MDCERVQNLYKRSCESMIKELFNTHSEVKSKEVSEKFANCAKSIKLYEQFCASKKIIEENKDR
jgi:hypothetical protein